MSPASKNLGAAKRFSGRPARVAEGAWRALDLYELKGLRGGVVSANGMQWNGPGPGHSPLDRSLSVTLKNGRALIHSFAGDGLAECAAHLGLDDAKERRLSPKEERKAGEAWRRAEAAERARKAAFCRSLWLASAPAPGTAVERYLRGRGIRGPIPGALAFHPAAPLSYDGRARAPAMVAMVSGPDGKSCGLHITAIKPDGSGKADLMTPRRMFGSVSGAAARLADLPEGQGLAVAEGIETALAYRDLTGLRVWACLSSSGLRQLRLPLGLASLTIAADGDDAGIEAAKALAERNSRRLHCAIHAAPPGQDWNDILQRSAL